MEERDFSIKVPEVDEAKALNSFVEWLQSNPNNFSFWFPKICHCFDGNENIVVPKSLIIPVPENMLECLFGEKPDDYNIVSDWFHKEVIQKIRETFPDNKELFIKNGCFSGKFDFDKNCHIWNVDVETLVKNFMSLSMDSLCFDTGGNLELIIREYISPKDDTLTIYNGMPFRPEIRMFYDFSNKRFCGESFYWDYDYCHERICSDPDDAVVYEENYDGVYSQYEEYRDKWMPEIISILDNSNVDLSGVWSIDFILEEDRAIMIDMAVGQDSAYYKEEYG